MLKRRNTSLKNRKNDKMKFKIYFLENDFSCYLYGTYDYK